MRVTLRQTHTELDRRAGSEAFVRDPVTQLRLLVMAIEEATEIILAAVREEGDRV